METLEKRQLLAVGVIAPVTASLQSVGDPASYLEYGTSGSRWIDGSGLSNASIVETGDPLPTVWPQHVAGNSDQRVSRIRNAAEENTLTFDLGGTFDVSGMVLWNSTEMGNNNVLQTDRGFENTRLSYSTDGGLTFSGNDLLTWTELSAVASTNQGTNPTPPVAMFGPEVQMLGNTATGVTHIRMVVDNFSAGGADSIVMASEIRFLGDFDAVAEQVSLNLIADMVLDSQALVFPDSARFSRDANGGPYRTEALLTHEGYQFATWYNRGTGDGRDADIGIYLARRDLSSNTWEVRDTGLDMVNAQRIWDSHNVISLGIASDGRLHLAYDMHANNLRYATTSVGRATGSDWHVFNTERDSLNSNSATLRRVTYPRFIRNGDDMLMTFREGGSGNGDIELIRYDSSAALPHRWVDQNGNASADLTQTIVSGAGTYINPIDGSRSTTRNAYLNGLDVDPNGRIHITWTWREDSQGSNHDINYAYSDNNGVTWRNSAGANLGGTVSINSPGIIISSLDERQALINQQGQAVDNQGGVHALMYHRRQEPGFEWQQGDGLFFKGDSAYFHYYRNPLSGTWTSSMLPTDRVVGSRPSIGFDSDNNVYAAYLTRAGGNDILRIARAGKLASGGYAPWEVIGEDLRDWSGTPLLDQDRLLSDNILSIFLQEDTTSDSLTGTNLHVLEYSIDTEVQTPYVPRTITDGARIEAEEFDLGGSELAYSDSSPGNDGNVFRTDVDVDIYDAIDGTAGFSVGRPSGDGEWMEYTADVVAGTYDIDFRLAASGNDTTRTVRVLIADDVNESSTFTELGTVSVPLTGSQSNWQTVTLAGVDLSPWAGSDRVIRVETTGFNFQFNWFEFNSPQLDFGDAPFETLLADDGARHAAVGPQLGDDRDIESDGAASNNADGDGDDEDGVMFGGISVGATMAALNIDLPENTEGLVDAWIDFNRNGVWEASEKILNSVVVDQRMQTRNYDLPSNLTTGDTYARVRLSSTGGLGPKGLAADGEVEDYRVSIVEPPQVESIVVNKGSSQRSSLESIRVTFDGVVDVNQTDGDPFQITRIGSTGSLTPVVVINQVNDKTVVDLTFAAGDSYVNNFGSLLDGYYQLKIDASLVTYQGVKLDGDRDGSAGDDYEMSGNDGLFRKYGDADGNDSVGLTDFATFRSVFGASSNNVADLSGLDSDGDGMIGLTDFAAFRANFGK